MLAARADGLSPNGLALRAAQEIASLNTEILMLHGRSGQTLVCEFRDGRRLLSEIEAVHAHYRLEGLLTRLHPQSNALGGRWKEAIVLMKPLLDV